MKKSSLSPLFLESVRDESSTSSYGSSVGMGVGFGGGGISSVSANASMNSGDSLNKKVVLSSITGDKVNIDTANNTNIKGSLIAAGSEDANGKFVDNGNLKLSTNTVTFSNLSNTSYSSSTGLQAGVSVSTTKGNTGVSSASYGASTSLGYSVTKTLATLGKGDITIKDKENSDDLTRLNTDTFKVNKELYSGGISSSVSATLDTRLLTKDGQKKIAEDFLKTGMLIDTVKEIATNSTVGITDFDTEVKKRNTTYETVKQKIASDPELVKQLSNPAYTVEQKNAIMNEVTNEVMVQLGYKPIETKLVSTTEPGRDGSQVKGYYSGITNGSYVNDLYNSSNYDLLKTSATETQRAIDAQNGSKFDQSQEYRADRSAYSQNFGSNVANYTDFALYYTNQGSLSTSANPVSVPNQATSMPSVFNNQVANNNIEFAGLDKGKGDNYTYQEAMALANKYPSMAIYKDPSIQGGYGVAPKDVAANLASGVTDKQLKFSPQFIKKTNKQLGEHVTLIKTNETELSMLSAEYYKTFGGEFNVGKLELPNLKFTVDDKGVNAEAGIGYRTIDGRAGFDIKNPLGFDVSLKGGLKGSLGGLGVSGKASADGKKVGVSGQIDFGVGLGADIEVTRGN